ncbi:hypothetical protein MKEN_00946600 [Mycena kentingensis (nom. inval.)]|nr:hypothetical protein MKEN_00946600 [Mycena kentingensis (nom. inval.)]
MHDNDVDAEIYSRIVTPYVADAFETNLRELGIEDEFPHLVRNLREGFPIGDMPILDRTIIIPNHSSVDAHEDVVQAYVDKELAANRISGPFSEEETERILGGAFVSSPLLVSENEQGPGKPPKYRVCRNLSKESKKDGFPDINSFVEKESFPTSFDSAYKMGDTVANAPPGTTACAFDIESFHRTIPVHPSHKRYLVFKFKGRYYIDHCHPFGLASASSNAGQVGSAISRIWTLRLARKGITLRYEDDISGILFPSLRDTLTRDAFLSLVGDLGVTWNVKKCGLEFKARFTSIGFLWDFDDKTVALPEEKRTKYLARLDSALSGGKISRRDLQRIHGTLVHVSFVHRDGTSYLSPISNSFSFYPDDDAERHLQSGARDAIRWWRERLGNPNYSRPLRVVPPVTDLDIWVDASTDWGIGVWIGEEWYALKLRDGVDWRKGGKRDICWLEALAIEVVVLLLAQRGTRDAHILVRSDNMGAIGAHQKGRSTNAEINRCVRRCLEIRLLFSIALDINYVPSDDNRADALSRGALPTYPPIRRRFDLPADVFEALFEPKNSNFS